MAVAMLGETPDTVRKIAKYLTPGATSEIRIMYPTKVTIAQKRMKGPLAS